MNQKVKLIVLMAVLAAVVGGAVFVYGILAQQGTQGDGLLVQGPEEEQSASPKREQAPDFTFLDSEGDYVSLSGLRGKPVVLNFWASWCPPCVSEMTDFEQMYQEYGTEVQFVMLNVTDGQQETISTAKEFVTGNRFSFPVFFDTEGEGARAFSVTVIPETFFIDREGNLVSNQVGVISESALEAGIESLLEP